MERIRWKEGRKTERRGGNKFKKEGDEKMLFYEKVIERFGVKGKVEVRGGGGEEEGRGEGRRRGGGGAGLIAVIRA